MELYRLEVNPKEIGVEVDTLTRNNIRRSPHYQRLYNIMEEIAEYSIQNGLLLGKAINDIYTMHINKFGKCILNPSDPIQINCIWPTVYEMCRPSSIEVKGTECSYFFLEKENCKYFKSYPGMKYSQLCKVEIIEEYHSFIGDMMWLENINTSTVRAIDIKIAADHYCNGDMTNLPIKEVLFQGKYKLTPLP